MEPDEAWVQRALESPAAFEELVHRYQRRIYQYALRYTGHPQDAEDITQETFVRAYRSLASFQPGRGFGPWLYKIAVNLCNDHYRARRNVEGIEAAEHARSPLGNPERDAAMHEDQEAVARALLTLTDEHRQAMVLRHIGGLSYQEIAEALQVPLGTVKTWLFRGREQLLAALGEARHEPV